MDNIQFNVALPPDLQVPDAGFSSLLLLGGLAVLGLISRRNKIAR